MKITKKIGTKKVVEVEKINNEVATTVSPVIQQKPLDIDKMKYDLKEEIKKCKKPTKLGKLFMKIVFGVIIFDVVSITFLVILMNL